MEKHASKYPQIASRVLDTPLLIERSKLVTILQVLGPRLGFDVERPRMMEDDDGPIAYQPPPHHLDGMLGTGVSFERKQEGHYVGSGIAIVPIIGTLVQRSDWMSSMSGMISYSDIERMMATAMNDPSVHDIVMEIDSPGGEVAGAFDLADRLYAMREQGSKKITAVAGEFAASGAYLLAATAHEIVVPRTGAVGSVGVVTAHTDYSRAMEKRGIAVTYIYAGAKKVDGNPTQPLPPNVKAEWQAEIDSLYTLFAETVAAYRGMDVKNVRNTQAGMFMGSKAVEAGMADRINSFTNEVANATLRQQGSYSSSMKGANHMANAADKDAADKAAKLEADEKAARIAADEQAAKDKKVKDQKAQDDAAAKDGAKAAGQGEKARIKAITQSEQAKGREKLASHLAYETDMTSEAALKLMELSPKEGSMSAAMDAQGGPGIRSTEGGDAPGATEIDTHGIYSKRAEQFKASAGNNLRPKN